ncbi:MAG: ribosome assembly cofactor RimP [Flavobacteriaceae bacterium]|nr:ribosome assembly cofactor RimP [Flavobacteriaceae bacterium]|tara:strand:+ start:29035 stop:29496 length:462 start_codon:yes stop_codon:yes gene_type:complete
MLEDKLKKILEDCFQNRNDLFIIDFKIVNVNDIIIIVDGDNGVVVEDCIYISRFVESQLDRDEYNFSLEVSSCGAYSDLVKLRQYKKHLGRVLSVKTQQENFEGRLTELNKNSIVLDWKQREPKKIGKGKVTVNKSVDIRFMDITEAKVKVKI